MTDIKTPGQDLFEAVQAEIRACAHPGARRLAVMALESDVSEDGAERPYPWGRMSAHARAVFSGAALRFLDEGGE